jgi:ribosomal protein S14
MSKQKQEHKPAASVKGTMECELTHRWAVKELNLERKTVLCPVCGTHTSIAKGLTQIR